MFSLFFSVFYFFVQNLDCGFFLQNPSLIFSPTSLALEKTPPEAAPKHPAQLPCFSRQDFAEF